MKVRNISGIDLLVPELNRVVPADAVVEVPDARADGYTSQSATWAAESAPTKKEK